jgi:hypothetical protein
MEQAQGSPPHHGQEDAIAASGLTVAIELGPEPLRLSESDRLQPAVSPLSCPASSTFNDPLAPPEFPESPTSSCKGMELSATNLQAEHVAPEAVAQFESIFPSFPAGAHDLNTEKPALEDQPYIEFGVHDPTSIIADDTTPHQLSTDSTVAFGEAHTYVSKTEIETAPLFLAKSTADMDSSVHCNQDTAGMNSEMEKLAYAFGEENSGGQVLNNEHDNEDDDVNGRDQVNTGRVDSSNMAVLENPLSKSDRYTVIRGRLPDNDPYMRAVASLGMVVVSKHMRSKLECRLGRQNVTEDQRREDFMEDVEHFNKQRIQDTNNRGWPVESLLAGTRGYETWRTPQRGAEPRISDSKPAVGAAQVMYKRRLCPQKCVRAAALPLRANGCVRRPTR